MKAPRSFQSLQFRLLGPLSALVVGFALVLAYLFVSFQREYSDLRGSLDVSTETSRATLEVIRTRARTQEILLFFWLNRDPSYLLELKSLNSIRSSLLSRIKSYAKTQPGLRLLGQSLVGGLEEASFLQDETIRAIQSRDESRARAAFSQLTTIFEINSARLKDFSAFIGNGVEEDRAELQDLFTRIFWSLSGSVVAMAMAIWFIAVFYRRDVLRPLHRLHRGLQELTHGHSPPSVIETASSREINDMVRDFNHMVEAIEVRKSELTGAREEALRAARIKTDFLSNMSHEIRTPMNAILGMADELSESKLDEVQRRYVEVLRNSGQVLLNVVNDILDYSRLEAGKISLETIDFDLILVSRRVAEVIRVVAERKDLEMRLELPAVDSLWLCGDPKRIEQILLNLLGNAVKFTMRGHITFVLEAIRDGANFHLVMCIKDTGVGIARENIAKIFERFGQSDTSTTRRFGGTGLGLAIVKQLVETMNGTITVKSEAGRGSEFEVRLDLPVGTVPVTVGDNGGQEKPGSFDYPKRILLVDDSADNRFLVTSYLKGTGAEIVTAETGAKAIELFEEQKFDLVLMDIQMPVMDGYTATRKIREFEDSRARPRTPILALSAYALPSEVERSLAAGCDLHITKPIRKTDLLSAIRSQQL